MSCISGNCLILIDQASHQCCNNCSHPQLQHPPQREVTEWAAQQVVEAFRERDDKRYLVRDRDGTYGKDFRRRIQSLGMVTLQSIR